ncbi:hypothetical protein H261_09672 [Paramagnetospirillum caucaseum]|uniref:Uncharacterized protein n=1 Tax=Paramagnetospirillum caucaseum TaxID=1244869 RepID=M3ABP1_9PROT|nr:mitofilin family membrane protein [Paramagnetospirillum caucaseum]EME70193.1 hypothetical protein H261_09672 [Paramagnetospirillum caucaseum]
MTSEPVSEPAAPAEVQSPPPRSSSGRLIAVAAILALGAGAYASFPLWRGPLGLPAAAPGESFEVENLRAELSAATSRIAQLEARGPATAGAVDATRLDRLEEALKTTHAAGPAGEVESLTKQVAELKRNSADAAALLRLADRLEQVETALRDLQGKRSSAAALLLAAGQLREAVAAGRPYEAEWRTARVLAGEDGESLALLDGLGGQAASGIATRNALAQRFDALAPALIRAEILPEGEGWWRRTADRLLSLVTIRREDGAAMGHNTAAIVGRAQAALSGGNLAAALAELNALDGGPAEAAAPWVTEAKARQAADKALSQLTAQALALAGAKL